MREPQTLEEIEEQIKECEECEVFNECLLKTHPMHDFGKCLAFEPRNSKPTVADVENLIAQLRKRGRCEKQILAILQYFA